MKFLFSDSLDFVDPEYDFLRDRGGKTRRAHQDDNFPHEHLETAPYDGLLISRAIVGDDKRPGKYSESQCIRFRREGAREFLRFPKARYPRSMLMGDCGAFSYRTLKEPPYTVDDTLEFYEDGGFTHGCSVDHLIFDFLNDADAAPKEARRRRDITLENARSFLRSSRPLGRSFKPVGVVQGWSAKSMAEAASSLCKMGYDYIAIGGMVPLRFNQIERALSAIRSEIPKSAKIHLLGFGKTEQLGDVKKYGIASFDTTSPLIRAFKDGSRNYYASGPDGALSYYMAIRIPQALDNDKLLRRAKRGHLNQDSLLKLEKSALAAVRGYAARRLKLDNALDRIIEYGRYALWDESLSEKKNDTRLQSLRLSYGRTLQDRPWESCQCRVCRELGVETLIFRSSNRNKRRGMHNLQIFYEHLRRDARR
jgi:Queuine tRNA-ribosyltransferase